MITVRTWVAVVLIGLAGLAGCKKSGPEGAHRESGGSAAGGGGGADGSQVLGSYIPCLNEADQTVHASWRSYTEWVDPKVGPTGKEKVVDGINQFRDYDISQCLEGLKAALAGGPPPPLVEPTKAYQTALTALQPIVVETRTYYEHKDYKDDGFAKGKELHTKLTAAFEAWDQANTAMRTQWDIAHRAQRDKNLARLEREHGRKSDQFIGALVMNSGEQMVEVVMSTDDAAALKTAIAGFQTTYDEMNAFYGPALTAGVDTDRYMFKQAADALLTQSKEARRALDAGKPLPADGDGSTSKLLDAYNELVNRSNDITW